MYFSCAVANTRIRFGIDVLNDARALHARHDRHFHVQQNHLRVGLLVQANQLAPVLRFAHNLKAARLFHKATHDQAHAVVVVRNQDADIVHESTSHECLSPRPEETERGAAGVLFVPQRHGL